MCCYAHSGVCTRSIAFLKIVYDLIDLYDCFAVVSGMVSTILSIFGGFMIRSEEIPDFWLFLYWLNPMHFALHGLFVTQFHNDNTRITLFSGEETTAEAYVNGYFSEWAYRERYGVAIALLIFIVVLRYCFMFYCLMSFVHDMVSFTSSSLYYRFGTYLCLNNLRHDKR